MQIAITAERVGLSIRNLMDEISLLKVEKNLLEDKQDFINYKTRMDKLKYDNGLISLIEYNNAETEYELVNQNLEVINNKIDLSFINFNSVLERTQDTQVDLEYNIEFKPVGEVDLDDKIIHSIEEDPYIWFCKENLETKNFKLITYEYNVPEGKSYSLTGLDVSEARKDLLYTEKELDRVIRERYNNLLLLEDQIKILELNHKKAKRTVNIIRLQYDSGMTTRTQLEDSQLKVSELEFKIQELKQQHTQLKILFEKPYLAPEYFGGRNKAIEI